MKYITIFFLLISMIQLQADEKSSGQKDKTKNKDSEAKENFWSLRYCEGNRQLWNAISTASRARINNKKLTKEDLQTLKSTLKNLLNDPKPQEKNYPYVGDANKLGIIEFYIPQPGYTVNFSIGSNMQGYRIFNRDKNEIDTILPLNRIDQNKKLKALLEKYEQDK